MVESSVALFNELDAVRDFSNKEFKSLCYAPFVSLSFMPDGNVSVCCMSRSYVVGNTREDRLDEIWTGSRVAAFRKSLKNYKFPPGCEECKYSLQGGKIRGHEILNFDGEPVSMEQPGPLNMEFALSNTCNLACIHCDSRYSSVHRAMSGMPPMVPAYGDKFFSELEQYLPHLKSATFLGGEPFLQKECFQIWDMMIDMDLHPTCKVFTNGSVYNEKVERVLAELPVNLAISADGISKETVELIRVNNQHDTIMQNIRKFNAYAQGDSGKHPDKRDRSLQLNFCLMRQNWHEMADFFLFAEEIGARVWTVQVIYPDDCSLYRLPREEVESIVEKIESLTPSLVDRLVINRTAWEEVVLEMRHHMEKGAADVEELVSAHAKYDTHPMNRAWELAKEGDNEGALKSALQVPASDENYYYALVLIGENRMYKGELAEAGRSLDEAVELGPRHPAGYARRAQLRLFENRYEDGLSDIGRAEECAAKLPVVDDWITEAILEAGAGLMSKTGNSKGAIARLDRLVELRPDDEALREWHSTARAEL